MVTTVPTVQTWFQMGNREILPIAIDFAKNLDPGDTITEAEAFLREKSGVDASIGLIGETQIDGSIVKQVIGGLTVGKTYLLDVTARVAPTKIWEHTITIYVT